MLILFAAMATEPPALPIAFQPMEFLIGYCWEGKFEKGEIDKHCFDMVYDGQHIRDRHEVTGGKGVYRGETIYSREGQGVTYTYWNSLGGVSRGAMKGEGDKLDFGTENHRTKDGRDIAIATHWQRQGMDAYQAVTVSTQMPSMNRTVTYRRVDFRGCRGIYGGTGGVHPIKTVCPGPVILPPSAAAANQTQPSDLDAYSQLADIGALARICDKRPADAVTDDWVDSGYPQRTSRVRQKLAERYGEPAVAERDIVSVHGCFVEQKPAELRRQYEAILRALEARF